MIRLSASATTYRVARSLGEVPKEFRRELRPRLIRAGEEFAAEVRANASWSSRIPGAVKVSASFSQRNPGVEVYVDSKIAPHAAPLEIGNRAHGTQLRHPVFGDRDVWVDQPTRPFLSPAVPRAVPMVSEQIGAALDDAFSRI